MDMSDLKKGQTYIGKVDRISGSENGIIQKRKCGSMISESGHLLIPEATEDWVGEKVKFEYLGGNEVRVITRDPSKEDIKKNKSNPVGDRYLNNDNDLLNGHQ